MLAVGCANGGGLEFDANRRDTRGVDAGPERRDSGEDAPNVDVGPRPDVGDAGNDVDMSDGAMGCVAPLLECAGICTDVSANVAHCGSCGNACASGEACASGTCALECTAGMAACSGACVDTSTDPAHCGGCGVACLAGEMCLGGTCTLVCPPGQTPCSGACVDLSSNSAHCGTCGRTCAPTESCMSGVCAAASETTIFPAAGDPRVASAGEYYFRVGDSVSGSRSLGLSSVRHADLVLQLGSNGLTCDNADVRFTVNGVSAGNFAVTPGMTTSTQSFDFPAVSGGTYALRLELTRTVASGCGSFTLPDGVSRVTFR